MSSADEKEVRLEWYRSNVQVVRELGLLAVKTLITLNSGAFVVLLTFVGNAAAQSAFIVPIEPLRLAMFCFLVGIISAFLVIAFAYVNNMLMNPFDDSKGVGDGKAVLVYLLLSGFSLTAFTFGVYSVVSAVNVP